MASVLDAWSSNIESDQVRRSLKEAIGTDRKACAEGVVGGLTILGNTKQSPSRFGSLVSLIRRFDLHLEGASKSAALTYCLCTRKCPYPVSTSMSRMSYYNAVKTEEGAKEAVSATGYQPSSLVRSIIFSIGGDC